MCYSIQKICLLAFLCQISLPCLAQRVAGPGIPFPPPNPVRYMAEWEPLEAIAIAFDSREPVEIKKTLTEIAFHAQSEANIVIVTDNVGHFIQFTQALGMPIEPNKRTFIYGPDIERIWIRDYGAHSVYFNYVDSLLFIDCLYDEQYKIADTLFSNGLPEVYNTDLFTTINDDYRLTMDGGNLLTDGWGGMMSSALILEQNNFDKPHIEEVLSEFMGIDKDRLAILSSTEYDVINHVDMQMKWIDEETIVVTEYPEGVADGPVIETNLLWLYDNYRSAFGNRLKVIRVPAPPDANGRYPDESSNCSVLNKGCYRTYTNGIMINKKYLMPVYDSPYDAIALDIWQKALPGYEIVPINCNDIIKRYGAVHCITKEIGKNKPLWMSTPRRHKVCQSEEKYVFPLHTRHISGVPSAIFHFAIGPNFQWQQQSMSRTSIYDWEASVDALPVGTKVRYYMEATNTRGEKAMRPMSAPQGYWEFEVEVCSVNTAADPAEQIDVFEPPYPNPSKSGWVRLDYSLDRPTKGKLSVVDPIGKIGYTKDINLSNKTGTIEVPLTFSGLQWIQIETENGRWIYSVVGQ